MSWIVSLLKSLHEKKYYGRLTISFEQGNIVGARKEETLKPPKKER